MTTFNDIARVEVARSNSIHSRKVINDSTAVQLMRKVCTINSCCTCMQNKHVAGVTKKTKSSLTGNDQEIEHTIKLWLKLLGEKT